MDITSIPSPTTLVRRRITGKLVSGYLRERTRQALRSHRTREPKIPTASLEERSPKFGETFEYLLAEARQTPGPEACSLRHVNVHAKRCSVEQPTKEEYAGVFQNNTPEAAPRLNDRKMLSSRRVYMQHMAANGTVLEGEARFVVRESHTDLRTGFP